MTAAIGFAPRLISFFLFQEKFFNQKKQGRSDYDINHYVLDFPHRCFRFILKTGRQPMKQCKRNRS